MGGNRQGLVPDAIADVAGGDRIDHRFGRLWRDCQRTLRPRLKLHLHPRPGISLRSITSSSWLRRTGAFEHYFGAMRRYWATNNIPDQSFDGLPQFNPTSGAAPLQGPVASNPGCDPLFPPPNNCTIDSNSPTVTSLHMISSCEETPSPFWNEDHVDFNRAAPLSGTATLDGFVKTAAHDARTVTPPFTDIDGIRAMSYYDGTDLPYYYFMASSFGTSDRWFSPS